MNEDINLFLLAVITVWWPLLAFAVWLVRLSRHN